MEVIDKLETIKSDIALTNDCTYLVSQLHTCVAASDQCKLPSTAKGHLVIHNLRNSSEISRVRQTLNIQPEAVPSMPAIDCGSTPEAIDL